MQGSTVWRYNHESPSRLTVTDPASQVTAYTYDSAGRLSGVALPGGGTHSIASDANDNRISITMPSGADHSLTYTPVNLSASYTPPYLNQFIQPDTIVPRFEDPRTLNRYAYAHNNPTNYTDPSGHDPWWCASEPNPDDCRRSYYAGYMSIAPLTPQQWLVAQQKARLFGLPPELVAGTIAVEVKYDTDWYDYWLDIYLQELPLILHYSSPANFTTVWCYEAADAFLAGYEHYWGLAGGRGPGNGVANVHILTAKNTETYFAQNYPDASLLSPAPDIYYRMAVLETEDGNIHYTAAILRQLADLRTGVTASHTDDLDDTDMEVIYSAFRASLPDCYGDLSGYQAATASPTGCLGYQIRQCLEMYRRLADD